MSVSISQERLDPATLTAELVSLAEWHLSADGKVLARQFSFKNFAAAWAFMGEVATLAEELNHHPDWSNSYGQVDIQLSTHESGGLSALDLHMARAISALNSP